jgi:hypothetical protein
VNNSVVRLGVVQGEYHWPKHDKDDEFACLSNLQLTYKKVFIENLMSKQSSVKTSG